MKKLEIKNNELKLVEEYKIRPDQKIELFFFEKYKDEILKTVWYRISNHIKFLPFEKNDYIFYIWVGIKKSLKKYDKNKNVSLKTFLINSVYYHCLKEVKKYMKNSELIMNYSYSYDELLNKNKNHTESVCGIDCVKIPSDEMLKELINDVIKLNNKFAIEDIKKTIYLRSIGNSILEISNKLNKPYRLIQQIINLAIKIAKNNY